MTELELQLLNLLSLVYLLLHEWHFKSKFESIMDVINVTKVSKLHAISLVIHSSDLGHYILHRDALQQSKFSMQVAGYNSQSDAFYHIECSIKCRRKSCQCTAAIEF